MMVANGHCETARLAFFSASQRLSFLLRCESETLQSFKRESETCVAKSKANDFWFELRAGLRNQGLHETRAPNEKKNRKKAWHAVFCFCAS